MPSAKEFWSSRLKNIDITKIDLSEDRSEEMLHYYCDNYLQEKATVLDLACGGGRNARYLAKRGYNVFGTDFSGLAVDFCRRTFEYLKLKGSFQESNMSTIPFENGFFAGVTCIAALDHVTLPEAVETIKEIRRVLSRQGTMFLTFDPLGRNEELAEEPEILPDGTWKYNTGPKAGLIFRKYTDEQIVELIGDEKIIKFQKGTDGTRRVIAR